MFDFDAGKFLIIGVVALVVIGPKELPRVLRQVGQAVGKMRRMAAEFQGQFMDAMKEADIESIRQDLKKISQDAELNAHFDPARDIQRELTASLDAPAAIATPRLDVETPATVDLTPPVVATEASALPEPEPEALFHQVAVADEPAEARLANGLDGAEQPGPTSSALADVSFPAPLRTGKKRKIRVAKRSQDFGRRIHVVADRTSIGRGRGASLIRVRSQESAER